MIKSEFDREKFKRLVHYVAWRTQNVPGFGGTKLNKVLWFADARMYMDRKRPITGATYIREKHGPVARDMMKVQRELSQNNVISLIKEPFFNRQINRIRANVRPDTSIFEDKELREVDYWIKHISTEHTAESISEHSHDYTWEIAKMGEEIPYYAIYASRLREPTDEEMEWAQNEAERLGIK